MNPYYHALLASEVPKMEDITLKLQASADTISEDIYWFRPYLTADFPGLICDKKYFFMWSTDHSPGSGGLYWGKGDNLDLSDFEVVGLILDGYQAETPFPAYFPDAPDDEKIHLFFHTDQSDPGNDGIQQTRLLTTLGGEWHTATYTDRGRPIAPLPDENHLGYMKMWGNVAIHQAIANFTIPDQVGTMRFSTYDPITRTFTRGADYDQFQGIKGGRWSVPTFGWFFNKYGQDWWIGTTKPPPPTGSGFLDSQIILAKTDANLQVTEQCALLNPPELEYTRNCEVYIKDDTAHIYFQGDVESTKLYYATFNLDYLQNFL